MGGWRSCVNGGNDSLRGVKLDVSDGSKSKQPSSEIHQTNTPTSGKGVGAGADPERLPESATNADQGMKRQPVVSPTRSHAASSLIQTSTTRGKLSMGKRPQYVPPIRIGSGDGPGPRSRSPLMVLSELVIAPVVTGTQAAYLLRHGHRVAGIGTVVVSLAAVVQLVIYGPRAWLAARLRWPPVVVIGITGVLLLVAVVLLGVISPGGSSSAHHASSGRVGQLSSGECFDVTGAATSCGSAARVFKLVKCSAVGAVDRGVVATAAPDFPELTRLANRASIQHLCLGTAG
jgi:hypothetical protein